MKHQQKEKSLEEAMVEAKKLSKELKTTIHIIEDHRDKIFYVEEEGGLIRNFETYHGYYESGKFFKI